MVANFQIHVQAVPQAEAFSKLAGSTLGPARLRLLPKANNLRPLVNMQRPCSVNVPSEMRKQLGLPAALHFAAPNLALAPLVPILQGSCFDQADAFGTTNNPRHCPTSSNANSNALDLKYNADDLCVAGWGEAHKRLRTFVRRWRAAGTPHVTAVAFDVQKAFDRVRKHG